MHCPFLAIVSCRGTLPSGFHAPFPDLWSHLELIYTFFLIYLSLTSSRWFPPEDYCIICQEIKPHHRLFIFLLTIYIVQSLIFSIWILINYIFYCSIPRPLLLSLVFVPFLARPFLIFISLVSLIRIVVLCQWPIFTSHDNYYPPW